MQAPAEPNRWYLPRMRARAALLALTVLVPAAAIVSPHASSLGPPPAEAAVSLLVTLDELVQSSTYVVLGTAAEHNSAWEETPSGRRIVTYTRIDVERTVAGDPGTSVWVRTLGGTVGSIGQYVSGEAQITLGSRSLLFLHKEGPLVAVTEMAQGHFPVIADDKGPVRLGASPDAGALLPRRGPSISAREVLVGATIERAVVAVQEARRTHEKR
jgi:hypothetical protein